MLLDLLILNRFNPVDALMQISQSSIAHSPFLNQPNLD